MGGAAAGSVSHVPTLQIVLLDSKGKEKSVRVASGAAGWADMKISIRY